MTTTQDLKLRSFRHARYQIARKALSDILQVETNDDATLIRLALADLPSLAHIGRTRDIEILRWVGVLLEGLAEYDPQRHDLHQAWQKAKDRAYHV